MVNSTRRLVGQIQRKLKSVEPVGASGCATPSDVAELRARIRRLHAKGDRFASVRLSHHVTCGVTEVVPFRIRGGCVATEV